MKSLSHLLLLLCTLMAVTGCQVQAPPPTKDEVLHLISVIPDHQLFPQTQSYFTREYYNLLEEAWEIPSDGIGELGSDEWLFYFITGNGGCNDFRVENISVATYPRTATVTFVSVDCGHPLTHTLQLTRHHHQWVIADYDSTFSQLKEYITTQRQYFQSSKWQDYLTETLTYNPEMADQVSIRQQEVEAYFKKYKIR